MIQAHDIIAHELLTSVQKLTEVIKSNTTDSLRIQRYRREIGLLATEKTSKRQME